MGIVSFHLYGDYSDNAEVDTHQIHCTPVCQGEGEREKQRERKREKETTGAEHRSGVLSGKKADPPGAGIVS